MLGSWLDHGCARRPYFLYTQLNFIIKPLFHGNILPLGVSKDAFDLGEPQQSGLSLSDFVSRTCGCVSGFASDQVAQQFSEALQPKERREQLVAEVSVFTQGINGNARSGITESGNGFYAGRTLPLIPTFEKKKRCQRHD